MTVAAAAMFLLLQAPAARTLSERAIEAAQQDRPLEAEELWKRSLQLAPDLFEANFNLGFFYFSRQNAEQAIPYLNKAAEMRPKDFNARYVAGAAFSLAGRVDDALRHWRAADTLRPGHGKLLQAMAVEYGKGRYYRDAAASAQQALALAPDDPNLYLLAIKTSQDTQDRAAALAIAKRMLDRFPGNARALFEFGFELIRAGRTAEGIPFLKQSMASKEAWEEPFFFFAETLVNQGENREAMGPLREAIARRRDYIAAWTLLARVQLRLGELEAAKATLLEAASINPKHPQPHVLLSQVYFRLGDEEAAAREKALSLRLRQEDPGALETLSSRVFPDSPR